jgi:lysophospholipase L1-like esterase
MGVLGSIPRHYVLDKYELPKIRAAIQHFNSKISQSATAHNIPLVDMNSFFKGIKNGYAYDGINFSSQFIQGAFFSLDGYHPTAQGYGLLANQFILTINSYYHSSLPLIDITTLPGIIFP